VLCRLVGLVCLMGVYTHTHTHTFFVSCLLLLPLHIDIYTLFIDTYMCVCVCVCVHTHSLCFVEFLLLPFLELHNLSKASDGLTCCIDTGLRGSLRHPGTCRAKGGSWRLVGCKPSCILALARCSRCWSVWILHAKFLV